MSPEELRWLDELVTRALAGEEPQLDVLGYGEISLVVGWPPGEPRWACKRLPAFPDRRSFDAYGRTLEAYLDALRDAGIEPVASRMMGVDAADGTVAGYVVQPALDPATLGPSVLRGADPAAGHPLVEAVVAATAAAVSPRVGLDAQISNWAWDRYELAYLDVTTPLLWSDGAALLDVDLLVQPLPWLMRGAIKRFVVPGILDSYRDLREVYVDICANLIKERLEPWIPAFLAAANARLERPIAEAEVRRYYRSDARLWEVLLRARRLDRAWQRRVRRRPYPFLLPRHVER